MTHSEYLYRIAMHITHNEDIAKDCVQETFLIASQKVTYLYKHGNPLGWLCKTLYLKTKELTRPKTKKVNNSIIKIEMLNIFDETIYHLMERLLSIHDTYFPNLEDEEFISKLKSTLTNKEIDYVKYKYIDGLTNSEIAAKLDISYTAVTTTGLRIKKKLKKTYKNSDKSDSLNH